MFHLLWEVTEVSSMPSEQLSNCAANGTKPYDAKKQNALNSEGSKRGTCTTALSSQGTHQAVI